MAREGLLSPPVGNGEGIPVEEGDGESTGALLVTTLLLVTLLEVRLEVLLEALLVARLLLLLVVVVVESNPAVAVTSASPITNFVESRLLQQSSAEQHHSVVPADERLQRITHSPPSGLSSSPSHVSKICVIMGKGDLRSASPTYP
jgi:hypothetical protein